MEYEQITGKKLKAIAIYARGTKTQANDSYKIVKENIDRIYEYDLVIYATAMGTGVSLETKHFDVVIGAFLGAMSIDDMLQCLYRYRLPVPRIVFLTKIGMASKHADTEYNYKANANKSAKIKAAIHAIYNAIISELPISDYGINQPLWHYHNQLRAIEKLECDNLWDLFIEKASEEYEITIGKNETDKPSVESLEIAIENRLEIEKEQILSGEIVDLERYEKLKNSDKALPVEQANTRDKTALAKKYDLMDYPELVNEELQDSPNC